MKEAILLLNLGGPATLHDVEPFLRELFDDVLPKGLPRNVRRLASFWLARLRSRISRSYYSQIGGGSPLRALTDAQADALEGHFGNGTIVRSVLRYTPPRAKEVMAELLRERVEKILLLPLYPQFSRATTESSVNEILGLTTRLPIGVDLIRSWYEQPAYTSFVVRWIERYLDVEKLRKGDTFFLFSAHALPKKWIDQGDLYLSQTEETVSRISEVLGLNEGQSMLGFQSRVGRAAWLEPTTLQCLRHLGSQGIWRRVCLIPISFVSDHVETLYELDIFLRSEASRLRLAFHRLPMFNSSPEFIDTLRQIVNRSPRVDLTRADILPRSSNA